MSHDPSQLRTRTWTCIQRRNKAKQVTESCPMCDKFDAKKNEEATLRLQYEREGKSKEDINQLLVPYTSWLKNYNVSSQVYVNAMTPKGEFGLFRMSYTTWTKMKEKMRNLSEKKKIDATALDQGVWFSFTRASNSPPVTDDIEVVTETIEKDGEEFQKIKLAPISAELAQRALAECKDLGSLFLRISREQVEMLAACSGEDPVEIDGILNMPSKLNAVREASPRTPTPPPSAPSMSVKELEEALEKARKQVRDFALGSAPVEGSKTEKTKTEKPTAMPLRTPADDSDQSFVEQFGSE